MKNPVGDPRSSVFRSPVVLSPISSPCPPVGSAPFTHLTSLRSAEPDGENDVRSERKTVNAVGRERTKRVTDQITEEGRQ